MKKSIVALTGALFSLTALGQDLLECLSPDLVNGVLFSGRTDSHPSVTATLPAVLAGYEPPADFALVGTAVRGNGASTTVAYLTSIDREEAYAAMLASFEADGWVIEEPLMVAAPIFVEQNSRGPVAGTICRDGERRYLSVDEIDGRRFASIGLNDQPQTRGCNEDDPRRRNLGMSMMSMLTSEAPTIALPSGTTAADGSGRINSGSGGSGDTYSTDSQIRMTISATEFMQDLAGQMSAQGWSADVRWSGALSQGGRWTRTSDEGILYWSTLELVDVGEGVFDLSFRTMMPPF